MGFFKDNGNVTGTKTNAIVGLVLALAAIASCVLCYFFGLGLLVLPAALWFFSAFQIRKGLKSEAPGIAKVGRVFMVVGAVAIVALCVMTSLTTIGLIGRA